MTDQEGMQRGVMYIGHLPHGFYERELKQFFSQFGKITRLRVCRSKKTGGCKGYGFIEFECDEVAKIAAETMNNYLMFEKLLKCYVISSSEVPKSLFRTNYKDLSFMRQRKFHNSQKTAELDEKRKKKMMKKFKKTKEKLAAMGIQYNYKFGKSLNRVSFSEDLRETEDENDKVDSIDTNSSAADVSIKDNTLPDKTPKKRSPKDRACKSRVVPLICTPNYRMQKTGLRGICSTSKKNTIQTLSVRKRSPKERKCKLNRRISML